MAFPRPDRTVVINLERRPDRLERFRADWAASGWDTVLGSPTVTTGVDGSALSDVPRGVEPGVVGCWASHVEVLRSALADGVACLAVLEDDAVPAPGSARWLSVVMGGIPAGAEALWLDATYPGADNRALAGPLGAARMVRTPLRTHAYLMTRALIERMLPVVERVPAHIDRAYALAEVQPVVFAATPSLAAQSGSVSDTFSDWAAQLSAGAQGVKAARVLRLLSSNT